METTNTPYWLSSLQLQSGFVTSFAASASSSNPSTNVLDNVGNHNCNSNDSKSNDSKSNDSKQRLNTSVELPCGISLSKLQPK